MDLNFRNTFCLAAVVLMAFTGCRSGNPSAREQILNIIAYCARLRTKC